MRPTMTEAEFERRQQTATASSPAPATDGTVAMAETLPIDSANTATIETEPRGATASKGRGVRAKAVKPRRVQRMFALEEDLDKKLWLYAIHVGKDRSEVINDLLRPLVASMVLYDSRDRRGSRAVEE